VTVPVQHRRNIIPSLKIKKRATDHKCDDMPT
jgi:hypothetical protein